MRGFSRPIRPAWQLTQALILNNSLPPEVRIAHGILTGQELSWQEFLLEWSRQYGYESYLQLTSNNNSISNLPLTTIAILLSIALLIVFR